MDGWMTRLKVRSDTLFAVDAVGNHVGLTSLAELRVEGAFSQIFPWLEVRNDLQIRDMTFSRMQHNLHFFPCNDNDDDDDEDMIRPVQQFICT